MDPFEPQLVTKKEVGFSECVADGNPRTDENFGDVFGGIIKSGQWGWLTKGSSLRITSLRTGQLISKFVFDETNGFGVCIITCVSEIQLPYLTDTIICIGIQYADCPGGLAVIYSVEQSKVIRCIELKHKITCSKFISLEIAQHTVLQNMNGCLAIGTDGGRVLLIDLSLRDDEANATAVESVVSVVPCHIVDYSMSLLHLHRHFQHCQQEGVHFGIQLEVLENAEFIQSLQPIDLILSLAVGLADGRLVLYDLTDMQVFYVAPPQERSSPLVKISFMEPPDDPRSCVYVWAFHENYQNSVAVMHSLMYEKRIVDEDGFCFFGNFQVACVRLLLPLNCPKCVPVTCQAITKAPSHGNEETISLCALVWRQDRKLQTEVLLFDINLWYKEEMPYIGDWREDPSYLASFVLKGFSALEMYFNPNTISLFNSIQRPEEHFYPVSLSFDCTALGENSCVHLNWPGAQNRVIDVLRCRGPSALLDPNCVFNEVLNTGLLPQFTGLSSSATFSLKAKREALLSVAIEQNCIGLLKDCARSWADGSHQGKSISEGLSLSTLTDWLWARASSIKERCNNLCQVLFDHSGCNLDHREQKELGFISKQLRTLADLLDEIITNYGESFRSDVLNTMESQSKSIRMASEYQEILLWLLNIGLLPEATRSRRHRDIEFNNVPYPYESLKRFYENRRAEFTRLNEKLSSRKTRSCYLLFIDSFIEHEFKGNSLRDSWQESGGNGLYPPISIQAMLRVMLIPDVTFDNKCALLLYFFLDLNMAIEEKQYESTVQNFIKFPSVFKLSASLIKQIQAFWNLDHCRFQAAVDEFISPFNKDQVCPQWQLELFLESLLAQNESNLSLRVLEAKSSPISPVLQLNTYLANDLISEAFHFARSKQDEDLLKLFFTGCLCTGKFGVIRDLALTEKEGNLVQSLLKNSKSRNAENLHFVYLLQKYKYIEAVSYLDELSKGRVIRRAVDVDTPTLVLSAYNTTMTPVTKGLSDVYFKIKNKIKSKDTEQNSPYPLSCQLIKQNANDLLGGIYHSSALSAHFASHYWERHHAEGNALQQSTNAPFLRRPQVPSSYSEYQNQKESISYPEPYKAAQKRRLDNSFVEEDKGNKLRDNPKKRRKVYDQTDLGTVYKPLNREKPSTESLLTHFKNAPTYAHELTSFTRRLQKSPPLDTEFFLETPYVKNTAVDSTESVNISLMPEKPAASLQSILKVSQSNITETYPAREVSAEPEKKEKKKETEEEKSIRFILPTVEDGSEADEEEDEPVKSKDSVKQEEKQKELPSWQRHAGPVKRKSLRSSTSYMDQSSEEQIPFKLSAVAVYAENTPDKKESIVVEGPGLRTSLSEVTSQPSSVTIDSPTIESKTSLEKPNDVVSLRSGIASRMPLRDVKTVQVEVSHSPSETEASFTLKKVETVYFQEQPNVGAIDTTENVQIIPVLLMNETSGSQIQTKSEDMSVAARKQAKRALSESSNESTYCLQRSAKQLKGRVPIHSPPNDSVVYRVPTALETTSKASAGNILKTDTAIDFKPLISSSRVCPTVSKFTVGSTEASKALETTSKVTFSERSTVLGGLTFMSTLESTTQFTETISVTQSKPRNRMLDTTVDMTLYDTMVFERSQQQESNDNSSSVEAPSQSEYLEEESTNSELNALEDQASESSDNNDDSDSVILLSSRSNSPRFDDESSEYSENRPRHLASRQTMIGDDDKDEDDDSDGIDIVETLEEDESSSFTNQFSEVTRTSTSCSVLSNTDTVLSGVAEVIVEPLSGNRNLEENREFMRNLNEINSTVALAEKETRSKTTCIIGEIVTREKKDSGETINEKPTTEEEDNDSETSIVLFVEDEELVSSQEKENEPKRVKPNETAEEKEPEDLIEVIPPREVSENVTLDEADKDMQNSEPNEKIEEEQQSEEYFVDKSVDTTTPQIEKETENGREKSKMESNEPKRVDLNDPHTEEIDRQETDNPNLSTSEIEITSVSAEKEQICEEIASESLEIEEKAKSMHATPPKKTKNEQSSKLEPQTTQNDEIDSEPEQIEHKVVQPNAEEVHTPNPRQRRAKSFSKTLIADTDISASPSSRRLSRGGSMPPSSASQILTRRRSLLLEALDEAVTPDSPSSRTRSKLRSDSIDGEVDSPSVSNVKRSRLSSISSVTSIELAQTPKTRRRTSMSVDKEMTVTPKAGGTPRTTRAKSVTSEVTTTPKITPRRLSVTKMENSPTDQTSPVERSSTKDQDNIIKTPEALPEISQSDDFRAARRLTRTQLAVLEKSAALAKQIPMSPARITRRRSSRSSEKVSPTTGDAKASDTESISSQFSQSSRRVTRSSALKDNVDEDMVSIASSTESGRSKRKRAKDISSPVPVLMAIPEEESAASEGSTANSETSKKLGRPKKKIIKNVRT